MTGFYVVAEGPLPITYQWRFNDADLAGETNQFLRLTSVNTAMEGTHAVVLSDANGPLTSPPATLRLVFMPAFVQATLNQRVVADGSVTFSTEITGTMPCAYQWRKGNSFATSTVLMNVESGEKMAFFTLTNVQPADAGTYRLYLANAAAPDFTSTSPNRAWTLTVLPDTDGDGLPDEWETKKTGLIGYANSADVKIFAIGFGAADRESLERLANGRFPGRMNARIQILLLMIAGWVNRHQQTIIEYCRKKL